MKLLIRLYMAYIARRMQKYSDEHVMEQMSNLPVDVNVRKDVPYILDGTKEHMMDIYYPQRMDAVMMPTVIDVHGGGFIYGSKEMNQSFNMRMAGKGFTVIAPNYRLVPRVTMPEQIQDILSVFRYIEEHLGELPCDPENMFLVGHSAGALLALYACGSNSCEAVTRAFGADPTRLKFRALGFQSGYFYVRGAFETSIPSQAKRLLFPKNYRSMEFYPYMDPGKLMETWKLPPCYLQTSREEILREHTLEFELMLTRRNVFHKLRDWDRCEGRELSFVFPVLHPEWEESEIILEEMAAFFSGQEKGRTAGSRVRQAGRN